MKIICKLKVPKKKRNKEKKRQLKRRVRGLTKLMTSKIIRIRDSLLSEGSQIKRGMVLLKNL